MRRLVLLITAACCGLSLSVSNRPEIVLAQTPPSRTDTIYFMGATRGNNYNGTGVLSWCVSQSWHPGYQLPDGTRDPYNSALDEVAQVKAAPPGQPGSWSDPFFTTVVTVKRQILQGKWTSQLTAPRINPLAVRPAFLWS